MQFKRCVIATYVKKIMHNIFCATVMFIQVLLLLLLLLGESGFAFECGSTERLVLLFSLVILQIAFTAARVLPTFDSVSEKLSFPNGVARSTASKRCNFNYFCFR